MTDPAFSDVLEKRSFQFFRQKTVESTNTFVDSRFWDHIVLQACHDEPAIKHAVLALSSLHQLSELQDGSEIAGQHRSYAEKQHQKALSAARKLVACASLQDLDRVMIACIIFICYENVRGDYTAASAHLCSGHQILCQNQQRAQQRQDRSEISQAFFRLHIPAVSFQDVASPLHFTLEDYVRTRAAVVISELQTVSEAKDALVDILLWLMIAADAAGDGARIDDRYLIELDKCALQHQTWCRRFEHLVQKTPTSAPRPLIATLKIWSLTATAILETSSLGLETAWDTVEHLFAEIVSLAEELASPSFSVVIGYIIPLFLTATRCRQPEIRR